MLGYLRSLITNLEWKILLDVARHHSCSSLDAPPQQTGLIQLVTQLGLSTLKIISRINCGI